MYNLIIMHNLLLINYNSLERVRIFYELWTRIIFKTCLKNVMVFVLANGKKVLRVIFTLTRGEN